MTLVEWLILLCCVTIVGAILWPAFQVEWNRRHHIPVPPAVQQAQ